MDRYLVAFKNLRAPMSIEDERGKGESDFTSSYTEYNHHHDVMRVRGNFCTPGHGYGDPSVTCDFVTTAWRRERARIPNEPFETSIYDFIIVRYTLIAMYWHKK